MCGQQPQPAVLPDPVYRQAAERTSLRSHHRNSILQEETPEHCRTNATVGVAGGRPSLRIGQPDSVGPVPLLTVTGADRSTAAAADKSSTISRRWPAEGSGTGWRVRDMC